MNTQKKFLTLLFICLLAAVLSSAQERFLDAVYLKNGSIIKGVIIENIINRQISIESAGNIYVYKYDEIEKIEKEKITPMTEKGFSNEMCFGLNVGDNVNPSITNTVFYTYKYRFMCGIGTGFETFGGSIFIPMFTEARYKPVINKFSPLFYVKGGYAAGVEDGGRSNKGGVLFEIGAGYFNQYQSGNAFTFALGFRYQESKSSDYNWWTGSVIDRNDYYRRVVLKIGINFH